VHSAPVLVTSAAAIGWFYCPSCEWLLPAVFWFLSGVRSATPLTSPASLACRSWFSWACLLGLERLDSVVVRGARPKARDPGCSEDECARCGGCSTLV